MTTATLPQIWRGRSGRDYVPAGQHRLRHGNMASVRKVTPKGEAAPTAVLASDEGEPLALKLWREGDESSLDQLQEEAKILEQLCARTGKLPCPRLEDLVGEPMITGVVMEWCPVDLEDWWLEKLKGADCMGRLLATLAEVCRRLSEAHQIFASVGNATCHGDLKPSNILLSVDGRWLISDFGTASRSLDGETTGPIGGTDNYTAPELLFQASVRHPSAVDTWAVGATLFSLLSMRRLLADGGDLPRGGTASPRFRMERMNRVVELFARDPTRFRAQELIVDDFGDPLRIPEADRKVVRDAMSGIFGGRVAVDLENEFSDAVLEILDRAMSIDPAHRYTDARDLAAAFEGLTRRYIALSARLNTTDALSAQLTREDLFAINEALAHQNHLLAGRLEALEGSVAMERESGLHGGIRTIVQRVTPPLWVTVAFVLMFLVQGVTLFVAVIAIAFSFGIAG